jgi:hypothetical protein
MADYITVLRSSVRAKKPQVVAMLMQGFARQLKAQQMAQKRLEAFHHLPAGRQINLFIHPAGRPPIDIGAVRSQLIVRRRRVGLQDDFRPGDRSGPCGHAADHPPGCFRGELVKLKAELDEMKRTMSVR